MNLIIIALAALLALGLGAASGPAGTTSGPTATRGAAPAAADATPPPLMAPFDINQSGGPSH